MKKLLLTLILSLPLFGCGSDSFSFQGVWYGSFDRSNNSCPFPVAANVNPLFPMAVSVSDNDVFTVAAADGSTAIGAQGDGEQISFLANAVNFGDFGSIRPYACLATPATVGFVSGDGSQASVTVSYFFNGCVDPSDPGNTFDCDAVYFADATKGEGQQ